MSLIFDRFPSPESAALFYVRVGELEPDLVRQVLPTAAQLYEREYVPFTVEPPIVTVERIPAGDDHAIRRVRELGGTDTLETADEREAALADLAASFGGRFAGT